MQPAGALQQKQTSLTLGHEEEKHDRTQVERSKEGEPGRALRNASWVSARGPESATGTRAIVRSERTGRRDWNTPDTTASSLGRPRHNACSLGQDREHRAQLPSLSRKNTHMTHITRQRTAVETSGGRRTTTTNGLGRRPTDDTTVATTRRRHAQPEVQPAGALQEMNIEQARASDVARGEREPRRALRNVSRVSARGPEGTTGTRMTVRSGRTDPNGSHSACSLENNREQRVQPPGPQHSR